MSLDLASRLNRWVAIQHRTETRDPVYNTFVVTWTTLATVWAEVQDMLPSRGEKIADGIDIARRPCRVRMRYRSDVDSTMRLVASDRTLVIVAGPAELGNREGIEFMCVELSTAGQDA